ncbi:MAG: FG-GAP-like repeat-containing protein, partial [Alphaproteobacteria bacterium]
GRLVVRGLLAEDRVSILTEGSGAGQTRVSGSAISYGGVGIGNASGGAGSDFTVTFNSAVTGAAVDALIQRLAYANVSDAPTATRTLTLDVLDASGVPANLVVPAFTALTGSANPFNGIDVGNWSTPSFVDLDGDGRLDLVTGAEDGTLRAWRNTGSATAPAFTALTGSANPFNGIDVGYWSTPSLVDLDGDGRLDLISGELYGTFLAWRNTGSAGAPAFTALTDSANPFNSIDVGSTSTPSFVDLDGDGRLDLVSGEELGTLRVWRSATPLPSITVSVTAENDAPRITSGATASFAENGTGTAYQAVGSDPEGATTIWTLGGADAGRFNISSTGAVTFKAAPNFEAPTDAGGNNVYDIIVTASDGTLSSSQNVAITVTDVSGATLNGTAGPDALTVGVGAENARLSGLGGNDTLTGGAGRDTLDGGGGNDVFIISDALDLIIETAGGGADTIITSVSMTMPDHVETLQIAAGISGITITGGAGNDMLIGNGLSNNFNGGAGDDVILMGNVTLADIHALFAT